MGETLKILAGMVARAPFTLMATLLLTASGSLLCQAATVISSSCNVTLQSAGDLSQASEANPTGGCGVNGPGIGSIFSASVVLTGSQTVTTSSFSGSVSAFGGPMGVFSGSASAQAQGTNTMELFTGGTVRPGYLTIQVQITPTFSAGTGVDFSSSFNIGSISATCGGSTESQYCYGLSQPQMAGYYLLVAPFTLGQSFDFSQTFDLSAFDAAADSPGSSAALQVSYSLTDANGSPVAVFAAPEPASWAMAGLGCGFVLAGVALVRKRNLPTEGKGA